MSEYTIDGAGEPFYVVMENRSSQIVISSERNAYRSELDAIPGVTSSPSLYHYSGLTRFPKRLHGGLAAIHHGLAFRFDNFLSVKKFVRKLAEIASAHPLGNG